VKITLLPSSVSQSGSPLQYLSSALVNDTVVIDAGCIGFYATPQEQSRVRHVLLTHTHVDHLASLPILLDNAFDGGGEVMTIHASGAALDSLQSDLFNGRLWPDFIALSRKGPELLRLSRFEPGTTIDLEGLRITAVALNHVVPTVGYLVSDGRVSVAYVTDTAPTEEIWQVCNRTQDLAAVFLEVTFPDKLTWLADVSKHLTPKTFARETTKLTRPARVLAMHLKPRYQAEVWQEVEALHLPRVERGLFDVPYVF
jgi:ribonuclease BN (tRNA processing enzyme)